MENMMLTAKILWQNGPSGVLFKALKFLASVKFWGIGK